MNFVTLKRAYYSGFAYQENNHYFINRKAKILSSIPLISTLVAIIFFYNATKIVYNPWERSVFVIRGILAFFPVVNLSLILVDGLVSLAGLILLKKRSPFPFSTVNFDE